MQENQTNSVNVEQQNENAIDIKAIFYLCLSQWYWFVLSVILALGVATFYLLKTTPVYTRTAKVLVKSDKKGHSSLDNSDFSDMGLLTNGVQIGNELLTIKSIDNIEEVVRRLHLDMTYSIDGIFHSVLLYDNTLPVEAEIIGMGDNASAEFSMKIKDNEVTLSDFVLNKESISGKTTGQLGDTVATPIGPVCVQATEYFKRGEKYKEIQVERHTIGASTRKISGRLTVGLASKNTDVMSLSIEDISRKRADDVLNMLIAVYNGNWLKDKNQIMVSTSMFIDDRLQLIEQELGNVDDDISSYKSENLLPDVHAVSNIYLNQNTTTNNRILDLNNQISITHYIRNFLANEPDKNQLLPVNSGINSSQIESQIGQYNSLMLRRNGLVANSSEQNPMVVSIDEKLLALRQAILTSLDNLLVALNAQLDSYQGKERQITARLAANPSQAKYLLSIERQQKVKESLYLFLLQKREENELSQAFTAYNTRVIEKPNGSPVPTKPKKNIIRLIAVLIGLAIPALILFLRDYLNTTVRSRKDLEKLSLPFIGEIPMAFNLADQKKKKKKGQEEKKKKSEHDSSDKKEGFAKAVVVKHGSRNVINEAFRVFRTNLEFMNKDKSSNVFMFTSFNPGSGKSFIAINSAISLAIKHRTVLVIDGDLRHASLSAYIFSPKKGIANYLARQEKDLQSLILKSDEYPGLSYLPVGTIPPNPTELLEDELFGRLITQLKGEYDYVLIDCPPIDIVADPQIINKYVDRTIFVVRAGLMERSLIPEIENLYKQHKYNNMSLLLNGTTGNDGRYGYKYGYRYGYKYGYKYGYRYGYKYGYHNNAYGGHSAYGYYHEDDDKTDDKEKE